MPTIVVIERQAQTHDPSLPSCFLCNRCHFRKCHASVCRKESSSIGKSFEIRIDEQTIAAQARTVFQEQRDQIAKAACRHIVLAWEKTV